MLLQKRIIEWSKTLPPWQRDLLRRLTAGPLDDDGRLEVLRILAGVAEAPEPVALELGDLPADEAEHGRVELRAIRELGNINCLAPGQALRFQAGLNAVFGDNGSGKSGYGRLIRRVTRSGEPEEILRDVFDAGRSTEPQTAEFDITVNDVGRTTSVDLATEPARILSAVTAFDASRARLSLAKPNVIEHVPRPLRLLRLLSRTQDELAETLRDRAAAIHAACPRLPEISADTDAGRALDGLGASTKVDELIAQAALSEVERVTLERLDLAAAAIATDQSQRFEATARSRAAAACAAAERLNEDDARLPVSIVRQLSELRSRLDATHRAEGMVADRAFADQRIGGTGQVEWREMWFAAQRFAEVGGATFPDPTVAAPCPLCQQDVDAAATQRLQRFQEFVTSDLRKQATQLEAQIATIVDRLPDVAALRRAVDAELRDMPGEVIGAARVGVGVLDARLAAALQAAAGKPAQVDDRTVEVGPLRAHAVAQETEAKRHAGLRDEDRKRTVLREREELRARAALVAGHEAIGQHVVGLCRIARIGETITQLNTQRISNKLRELQQVAITERLRKAVEHEVSELYPVAGRVEIIGQASKGETVIHLTLKEPCRARISNVLSDGEQRALALAFFLAEVAVSDERSAIVLDDPVSSLDHGRRAYLAQRLAEEAQCRQVVVFTHDMAFVHMLQAASAELGINLHGQTLQRAFHRVGVVVEELPLKMLGTAKQLRHLRHRLRFDLQTKHKRQDPSYEQEADRWVADLRKAYDQIIEDTVLNDTVRRFHAHVQVRRLHGVRWTPQVADRIDRAVRRASPKAHHEALALHPAAHTPDELEAMLDDLASLHHDLGGKPDVQPGAVPDESGEAEPVVRATHRQR